MTRMRITPHLAPAPAPAAAPPTHDRRRISKLQQRHNEKNKKKNGNRRRLLFLVGIIIGIGMSIAPFVYLINSPTNTYNAVSDPILDSISGQQQQPSKEETTSNWCDGDVVEEAADNNEDEDKYNHGNGPFFDEHCQLTHNTSTWRLDPHHPTTSWQSRTPYFLLIGAKKAGTTTLWSWLRRHPHIVSGIKKELLYFLPTKFTRYAPTTRKVQIENVRHDLYTEQFPNSTTQRHRQTLAFEATPDYLTFSTVSRIPILCSLPWIKLLVTLRDPIDRCFSNYNFLVNLQVKRKKKEQKKKMMMMTKEEQDEEEQQQQQQVLLQNNTNTERGVDYNYNGKPLSFEEALELDFANLRKAGVIPNNNTTASDHFAGSPEEQAAWTRYQKIRRQIDGPVGRSLYVLQLLEWHRGLRDIGRDPTTEMLVVRNEDMKDDAHTVYNTIIQWLALSPHELKKARDQMVTTYRTAPMKEETRKMLHEFFEPYNRRLYCLLGWDEQKMWKSEYD